MLKIDGPNLIGDDGQVIVPVGVNLGLGELARPENIYDAAAAGANAIRIISRWFGKSPPPGYGTNFQVDSFDEAAPHRVRPDYVEMLKMQAQTARSAGMKLVDLGMDSNQLAGMMGGADAWTVNGQRRRTQHIALARYLAQAIAPDTMEPIVEPQGLNVTQALLWSYQEQFMSTVLAVAPNMLFPIGGLPAYQAGYIRRVFKPEWALPESPFFGHVLLTCNMGSDLCMDAERFEQRLAGILAERDRRNVPVLIDQIWTEPVPDPDGLILADRVARLKGVGIGSMVWTDVVRYGPMSQDGIGGPGLHYLAHHKDPDSEHIPYGARWENVAAAWRS